MFQAVLLFSLVFSVNVYAQQGQDQDKRAIGFLDLGKSALELAAIDLVCDMDKCGNLKNKPLNPAQVGELINKKIIKDASELNPTSNSILWSKSLAEYPYKDLWMNTLGNPIDITNQKELGFEFSGEVFNYQSIKPDGFNNLTSVYVRGRDPKNPEGQKFYNVRLGNLVHNNLLRKGILRKLGYFIPPVQYLKTYKIHFANFGTAKEDKVKLINDIYQKSKSPTDWISNLSNDAAVCITAPPADPNSIVIDEKDTEEVKKLKQQKIDDLIAKREQCNEAIAKIPDTLEMRGSIIYDGIDDISYNLSRGSLGTTDGSIIMGRRLLNSLFIPYTIVDTVPQVKLFEWVPGREQSKKIVINHEEGDIYRVSRDDATWILRRMAKLTREDFAQIIKAANFEIDNKDDRETYEKIVTEKMISRLAWLLKKYDIKTSLKADTTFNVPASGTPITVKNGQLQRDLCKPSLPMTCWEQNPESPLDRKEYFALGKSILMGNGFRQAVKYLNEEVIPEEWQKNKDIGKKLEFHRLIDRPARQFARCLVATKEGEACTQLPDETFTTWYKNVNLILSRNTVFGSFLGADYPIQLAKTIGFVVGGGLFAFRDGLPSDETLIGDIGGNLIVTYTHLKGTLSVEAANKDPLKNIFVPSVKWKNRHILEEISEENLKKEGVDTKLVTDAKLAAIEGSAIDVEELKTSPVQLRVNEIIAQFKASFGVQESVIITKTLAGSAAPTFGKIPGKDLLVNVGIGDRGQLISRLHLNRNRENTIQIFKSSAAANSLDMINADVGYYGVPVVGFDLTRTDGAARTNFFSININPDISQNPWVLDQVAALAKVLLTNDIRHLEAVTENTNVRTDYNPYRINHAFHAPENAFKILPWQRDGQKILDTLTIKTPEAFEKKMITTSSGVRWGRNLQDFVLDILNSIIEYKTDWDFDISVETNSNPGDTIFGKQRSRRASIEGERFSVEGGSEKIQALKNTYGAVEHSWHGWQATKATLTRIINAQEARFGQEIYPEEKLQDIELSQLYTLLISVKFYQDAIEHMANLSPERVREIFGTMALSDLNERYPNSGPKNTIPGRVKLDVVVENFVCAQEAYKISRQHTLSPEQVIRKVRCPNREFRKPKPGDPKMASNAALHMINRTEGLLTKEGIWAMAGGKDEVYIESNLDGFKKGDATGYKTVNGDSSGLITSPKQNGPLKDIMKAMDINVGEFYIYWLLNKL